MDKSYKLSKNSEKNRDLSSSQNQLKDLVQEISAILKQNKISLDEFTEIFSENEVPVSIFNSELSPLESLVQYLKRELKLSEIARLLNRDDRSIWTTYNNATAKKVKLNLQSKIHVPIEIFSNRKLSVLENLCRYLREDKGLSLKEISELLGKSNKTIWTVYNRAKKKQ